MRASYSLTAGQGTLSSHPAKVLRLPHLVRGYRVYRLVWDSGSVAESGTVTIQVSSSVKDVAGNALSGTLSQSDSGTKRVLAVNCGESEFFDTYAAPFIGDGGFQGNDYTPFESTEAEAFYGDGDPIYNGDGTPSEDQNDNITVSLVPQQGMDGYGAAINGIEVVKP